MSIQFVQVAQNSTANAAGTTVTTNSVTNTAGNLLIYCAFYDANYNGGSYEPTFGLTDTLGNTYVPISTLWDASLQYMCEIGYVKNCAGGSNAATLTLGGSGSPPSTSYKGVAIYEFSGCDTVSPFEVFASQYQASNNTNANALTSGATAALSHVPALVFGFSSIAHNTSGPPTVGSGFTAAGSPIWTFGQALNFAQGEYEIATTAAAQTATFTPSTASGTFFNFVATFKAATAPISSNASDTTTATGALTTAFLLAANATDALSAAASLLTVTASAGAASDTTSATGALTAISSGYLPGDNATDTTSASGVLGAFASVTLAGTLYTGVGGILDPHLWQTTQPQVGSIVYYDPTNLTILTDGEFVTTSNNFSAVVQFFDGTQMQIAVVTFTPGMVGYATDLTTAAGALSTADQLASAALTLTSGTANLYVAQSLNAAATDVTSAAAALQTSINLAAQANDVIVATGALQQGAAALQGNATDTTSGTGAIQTMVQMAASAVDLIQSVAALSTQIVLAGAATDTTSSATRLNAAAAVLAGAANDAITAAATLVTQIQLASQANNTSLAVAALSTQIQLAGQAIDALSASATLVPTAAVLIGSANDVSFANASLTAHMIFTAAAQDLITAGGSIITSIQLMSAASDTTSGTGNLTTNQSPVALYVADPLFTVGARNWYTPRVTPQFPIVTPGEEHVLTFDFSESLENGEQLMGVAIVGVACSAGTDTNPAALYGSNLASFSADMTQVSIPVTAQESNLWNDYYFVVNCATTNPLKILARSGLLQVQS